MPWTDAFLPMEAANRKAVMRDTWGHLAPQKNKTYPGFIVFAIGCYDALNPVPVQCEFAGLDDSPWFFDALNEFIGQANQGRPGDDYPMPPGTIWRFDGVFRNYEFRGEVQKVELGAPREVAQS